MTTTRNPKKATPSSYADIEIFAGTGGMTLGLQKAGFRFSDVFEIDPHTCATLENNHASKGGLLAAEVHNEDVSKLTWDNFQRPIRLLAGGAPCQPFSLAGRHLAEQDNRNMFPAVLRAVRSLRPLSVMLENVPGLARPSFHTSSICCASSSGPPSSPTRTRIGRVTTAGYFNTKRPRPTDMNTM